MPTFSKTAILSLIIFIAIPAASQLDLATSQLDSLDRHGVAFSLDFSSDIFGVSGADRAAETSQQWLDLSSHVELGRLSRTLSRTRAFVSLHVNSSVNNNLGNPLQALSGLQTAPGVHLAEFWIERNLSKWALLRAGKVDANRDFAAVSSAAFFLNSTQGYDPTFSTLPNYNDTTPGVELLLSRRGLNLNLAAFSPLEGTGALLMEETSYGWNSRALEGRGTLGIWQMTGKMPSLTGGRLVGARGTYLALEQTFWYRERDNRHKPQTLTAFAEGGATPSAFSAFSDHLGCGLLWKAPTPYRDHDAAGFAFSRGHVASENGLATFPETAWEAFYRIQYSSRLSFTPDLQYITKPAGEPRRSLFAFGVRMTLSLKSHSE